MEGINKQTTGFKFGTKLTKLLHTLGTFVGDHGKHYRLVIVETDGNQYYSIRLYNHEGRFLKQLMFEIDHLDAMYGLLARERQRRMNEKNKRGGAK